MKRGIITISESGVITIPSVITAPILMRDYEIAELFGIYAEAVKTAIKAVLKSGAVAPDYTLFIRFSSYSSAKAHNFIW